jgi:hypothetical protein
MNTVRLSHPRARPAQRAFTLIELLAAAFLSILLVTLLLSVTQRISAQSLFVHGKVTRQSNGAFALDQIVQDLESMVVPHFPRAEALRITPERVGPSEVASSWMTLLTAATDEDSSVPENPAAPGNFPGATRAVSFRIAHKNPVDGGDLNPTYCLYRAVASARDTFDQAMIKSDAQQEFWPLATVHPTDPENILAENVVGVSLRFLKPDGAWTSPGSALRIGRDGTTENGREVPGGVLRAEVCVTTLSAEGTTRLAQGFPLADVIREFGQTSVRQTASFR